MMNFKCRNEDAGRCGLGMFIVVEEVPAGCARLNLEYLQYGNTWIDF